MDNYLNRKSDRLCFVSFNFDDPSSTNRDFREIMYRVVETPGQPGNYCLVSAYKYAFPDADFDCFQNLDWWSDFYNKAIVMDNAFPNAGVLAENVRNFEVYVYDKTGMPHADYDSTKDGPPLFADVYLEILAQEDAEKSRFNSNDEFLDRATQRYQMRVYFQNRKGYEKM
jgi:hypothetical protein